MPEDESAVTTQWQERAEGGRVARVVVVRPARLNCLDSGQIARLIKAMEQISEEPELRAVVLTGGGEKAFVGGADLRELADLDPASARVFITALHGACAAVMACPVPVIARINGYCLGAGLELAASCDLRLASDEALFGMPEVLVGIPSVIEAALLPGLIGWGKTREILLTGDSFGAERALAMGLIEKVVPAGELDPAVEGWLDPICRAGPRAVRAQKALIAQWQRAGLEGAINAGIDSFAEAYRSDEPKTMMEAFFAARRAAKVGP